MFGKQKLIISSMLLRSSCDSFNLPRVLVLPVVWTRREGMGVYPPIWAIRERVAGQGMVQTIGGTHVLNK